MSDCHIQAQTLDRKLVATISSMLTSAGVPNILWGNYLLTVYGVPTIVDVCIFSLISVCKVTDMIVGRGLSCAR